MSWLDNPLSSQTGAMLSCLMLGGAAGMLGSYVGMATFQMICFAVLVASGLAGIVDHLSKAIDRSAS